MASSPLFHPANTTESCYQGASLVNEASLQRAKGRCFCLNIQHVLEKSFICMSQRIKKHKYSKPSASFSKTDSTSHSLPTDCLHALAGSHGIRWGLTAEQGWKSDYIWGQKVSLNLITDSKLFLLLQFRELRVKFNTMFSYNLK